SRYSRKTVLGVVKAYTTRVGQGPFPTEQTNETGGYLQNKGAEFGSTTGRKRRCGWLDLVILREAVRLCGMNEIALTKLDVLSGLKTIKICTAYEYQGTIIDCPPQEENGMARVKPVYEEFPGWTEDLGRVSSLEEMPANARNYIQALESRLGVRVSLISVGPDRTQTIRTAR
ncbi:MAG: adenylosuccinate synthetase, partial [Desulfonatronovibrionaceae bacterium]